MGHVTVTMELLLGCVDVLLRLGWGGVGHVTVTMEVLLGCVDVSLRLGWGGVGHVTVTMELQASHQMRQYGKDINDPSIGRMPAKAGTQCSDSDWKSLKVWLPNQTRRKQKVAGISKVNPRLVLQCYQWCWRRSTGNPKPNQSLKELAKLFGNANKRVRKKSSFCRRHF